MPTSILPGYRSPPAIIRRLEAPVVGADPTHWRSYGNHYDSVSAITDSGTLTVPANVAADWYVLVLVAWSVTTGGEVPPATSMVTDTGSGTWQTVVAARTDNNMGYAVFKGTGFVAGDTFHSHFGAAETRVTGVEHSYWQGLTGFGTPGTITERGGVSGAVNTAVGLTTTENSQEVVVVSTERTPTVGTTVAESLGTRRDYYETGSTNGCSYYFGTIWGPVPTGSTSSVTITYSSSSGNGGAFQLPILTAVAAQPIVAAGISGGEASGQSVVTPGVVTVTATGISGVEAVGASTLTQTVTAAGISGAEAVGAAATGQGLVATGITTAEQSGQSVVTPGAVTITTTGISGGEQVNSVALNLNLAATGIGTGEASGQPQLGQGLVAVGISTGERDGQATVTPGAVTIAPTGISSGEQSGSSTLNLNLAAAGTPTGQASGQAQLGQGVVAAGISTGERSGSAVVTPGTATIAPAGISSLEQSGASTVTPGLVNLAAVGISSLAAMGNAAATLQLAVAGISTGERLGIAGITQSAPAIAGLGIRSAEVVGSVTLTGGVTPGGALNTALRAVADLGTGDRAVSSNRAAGSGQPSPVSGKRDTATLTEIPRQTSTLTGG